VPRDLIFSASTVVQSFTFNLIIFCAVIWLRPPPSFDDTPLRGFATPPPSFDGTPSAVSRWGTLALSVTKRRRSKPVEVTSSNRVKYPAFMSSETNPDTVLWCHPVTFARYEFEAKQ